MITDTEDYEANTVTQKEEMGWGMNASNMHTSKCLDKFTVLDTAFKLQD